MFDLNFSQTKQRRLANTADAAAAAIDSPDGADNQKVLDRRLSEREREHEEAVRRDARVGVDITNCIKV